MKLTRITLLAPFLLAATGCLPDGVVWTPDGKALLWTEDRGTRVVRYDLVNKERHVVAEDTDTQTLWPALSPDGKLIAVARVVREDDEPGTMQVILLDGEGDEVKSSKEVPWLPADKKGKGRRTFATALYWATGANRILVFAEGKTGIYDPEKNTLLTLENVIPMPVSAAPVRPDGKGFLALVTGGERTEIAFIDWDGKRHTIDRGDKELKGAELVWDKDVARLIRLAGTLELDTAKLTAAWKPEAKPELLPADSDLACLYTFPDGKTKVCVYDWLEKRENRTDLPQQRVEIQRPGDNKREILERRTRGLVTLFPSPDRQFVAVRYRQEGRPTQVITIIDAGGKVVHEINLKD